MKGSSSSCTRDDGCCSIETLVPIGGHVEKKWDDGTQERWATVSEKGWAEGSAGAEENRWRKLGFLGFLKLMYVDSFLGWIGWAVHQGDKETPRGGKVAWPKGATCS